MVPAVKARADVDGCGCVSCREIDAPTLHRTVLDMLVWSAGLCRRYPSVLLLALVFVLAEQLVTTVAPSYLPKPPLESIDLLTTLGSIVFLRAFVSTIVAGELTESPTSPRTALWTGTKQLLPLTVLFLGTIGVGAVLSILLWLPVIGVVFLSGIPSASALGTVTRWGVALVTILPFLFVVFRFGLAIEAYVIGSYNPVKALRISWRITANHHGRFIRILLVAILSTAALSMLGGLFGTDGSFWSNGTMLQPVTASLGELTAVVWYAAFAHLYVQAVVEDSYEPGH